MAIFPYIFRAYSVIWTFSVIREPNVIQLENKKLQTLLDAICILDLLTLSMSVDLIVDN